MELLWAEKQPGARGPRRGLSIEQIARAAVEIADTEGLDKVSMQRVAAKLGYTTMSLYNYVPSKKLLIEVMCEVATGSPPELDELEPWRVAVERWAVAARAIYVEHPWMLDAVVSGPPVGPNQLAWWELGLRAVCRSGLPSAEAMAVMLYLLGSVRGLARLGLDVAAVGVAVLHEAAALGALDGFPTVAAAIDEPTDVAGGSSREALESAMIFGIHRLLDGVEAHVSATAR